MDSDNPNPNIMHAIQETRSCVVRLAGYFSHNPAPKTDSPVEWFTYLAKFRDELGNLNNDVSLLATILAQQYLEKELNVVSFDALAKAQGARGPDIDAKTARGERVIAEIKTTHPYKPDDLGAQQANSFKSDAAKLRRARAEHKFFFVTDELTFHVMSKLKYRRLFEGIRVVLLPSGNEVEA